MEKSHVGMARCFFCGEHDKILVDRRLKKSLPRDCGVIDMEPCDKCGKLMEQGIMLIIVADGEVEQVNKEKQEYDCKLNMLSGQLRKKARMFIPNPQREGMAVIKEHAFRKICNDNMFNWAQKHRWIFMEKSAADAVGLIDCMESKEKETELKPYN